MSATDTYIKESENEPEQPIAKHTRTADKKESPMNSDHSDNSDNSSVNTPANIPTGQEFEMSRLVKLVYDEDQPVDHGGEPVAPLTPAGLPFRYRLREGDHAFYASTADDLLAVIIDDYPEPTSDDADDAVVHTYDEAALSARTLHAFGVITNHVAAAIISGNLTADQERMLRRSAERGPDYPPITADDCPTWDADDPMILIAGLYHQSLHRVAPAGNVIFIDPGTPEHYLWDLARIGEAQVYENPVFADGHSTITSHSMDKPMSDNETGPEGELA